MKITTKIPSTQLCDGGSYAEYVVNVSLDGSEWTVHMRYSEFAELEGKITKSAYLPAFPQKKWFGSNSPEVIEQRRGELERWLSAAVQTQECLTDPAFLGFLAVPLPSPVMRAGGAAPEASALGASGGSSSSSAKPEPITLNASVEVSREMDEGEFADHLLEQTQALLIDVAEIPRPLEGEEVEQRMEQYSDEISEIALALPPTANRLGGGRGVRASQGFGLPLPRTPPGGLDGVAELLRQPSTATADKELMATVEKASELLARGVEAFMHPVPGAGPLLVGLPAPEELEGGDEDAPAPAPQLGRAGGSLQGYTP